MSNLSQFIGGTESVPIGESMHIYSDQATVTVNGMTFLRSGVIADAGTYPLARVINPPGYVWSTPAVVSGAGSSGTVDVNYCGNLFITSDYDTTICRTSPDGITWTARTFSSTSLRFFDVTYGNGMFVAIASGLATSGTTNIYCTSPDGITWTQRTLPIINAFSITYGAGLFLICFSNTTNYYTSPDGITWTARTFTTAGAYRARFFNNLFILSKISSTLIITSPDGITWTRYTFPVTQNVWNRFVFGNGVYVFPVYNSTSLYTTTDFVNWTLIILPLNAGMSLAFGNGTFIVGSLSNTIFISIDNGVTWISKTITMPNPQFLLAYGSGVFIAINSGIGVSNKSSYSTATVGVPVYTPSLYFRVA